LTFDWDDPRIVHPDPAAGHAILPQEWDAAEDAVYDEL
jgi:hypothetical protein